MSRYEREKGKRGEREVVALLKRFGIQARRQAPLQAGDAKAGPDVHVDGLWIEVKLGKHASPYRAMAQAKATCPDSAIPVAFTRRDGSPHHPEPWLVTFEAEHLLAMLLTLEGLAARPPQFAQDRVLGSRG